MLKSTVSRCSLAISLSCGWLLVVPAVLPVLRRLGALIGEGRTRSLTPEGCHRFEEELRDELRELGRVIVETLWNGIEPDNAPRDNTLCPAVLVLEGEWYRRRDKSCNTIGTLFGEIVLWRYLYEPIEQGIQGLRSVFLLEIRLGIEAGLATPALAECVGWWIARDSEQVVLDMLQRDHRVGWSSTTLRKLGASLNQGMASHRHEAQVAAVVEMLKKAFQAGRGTLPVLSVGRDGIFVPMRGGKYQEGSVATLAIYDRKGKRLGTVYLACMPEEGQGTLTRQLTALIEDVLRQWTGPLPRLVYVTDDGSHPHAYYDVLRRMKHPRDPRRKLHWERIIDYFHACEYITKLAEALYGATPEALSWARRMRHVLRDKPNGIVSILRSAAALFNQRNIQGRAEVAYGTAYLYLQRRRKYMQYHAYRKLRLPIGSGVTEAACKTIFTQRFKQSGMSWTVNGGQIVLNLRVILLSKTWNEVYRSYMVLKSSCIPDTRASAPNHRKTLTKGRNTAEYAA